MAIVKDEAYEGPLPRRGIAGKSNAKYTERDFADVEMYWQQQSINDPHIETMDTDGSTGMSGPMRHDNIPLHHTIEPEIPPIAPDPDVPENDYIATPNELTRDYRIYDTHYSSGRNDASIPLSGTISAEAPVGSRVFALLVNDETGATVHAAKLVATVITPGVFAGSYDITSNANQPIWLRAVVFVEGNSDGAVSMATRLGCGHVIMNTNQSITQYALTDRSIVADDVDPLDNRVHMYLGGDAGGAWYTSADVLPQGIDQLLASIQRNTTDLICVAGDYKSGSSFETTFQTAGRLARTLDVINAVQGDGAFIGTYIWDHSYNSLTVTGGEQYEGIDAFYPAFFTVNADGSAFDVSTDTISSANITIDRTLLDVTGSNNPAAMLDLDHCRILFCDAHILQLVGKDAVRHDLSTNTFPDNGQQGHTTRVHEIAQFAGGGADPYVVKDIGPASYTYSVELDDGVHPTDDTGLPVADGCTVRAYDVGYLYAYAAGNAPEQPLLDIIEYVSPTEVLLSSSAGPITTREFERTVDTTILGVSVGKIPVTATLVAGKIRVVMPYQMGALTRVRFGEDGGNSAKNYVVDRPLEPCTKIPMVDNLLSGDVLNKRAIGVRPVTFNTTDYQQYMDLPALPNHTGAKLQGGVITTVDNMDVTNPGAVTAFRLELRGSSSDTAATVFATWGSLSRPLLTITNLNQQAVRATFRVDTGGTESNVIITSEHYVWSLGEELEYVITGDTDTGVGELYVNGVLFASTTELNTADHFAMGRQMVIGGINNSNGEGVWSSVKYWAGSTDGVADPTIAIEGGAAEFNAGNAGYTIDGAAAVNP